MCCDLCDFYLKCEEVEGQNVLCCGKCEELGDCHGGAIAGRRMAEEDDFFEDPADSTYDDDYEEEDYDDEGYLDEDPEYDSEFHTDESYH